MFNRKKPTSDDLNPYAGVRKQNAFAAWYLKHKKATIPVTILLILTIGYAVFFFVFLNQPEPEPEPVKEEKKEEVEEVEPVKYYSPLTGVEVPTEADTTKPINAVILENTPAARPQSGLQEAELVYEATTEAGITRFLAFYQQNQPELIGPVRSLRPSFIDWLAPYEASVLHVGGSKEALDEIRNGQYRDLDQFFNGGSYWRSTDRYAPHNVYTNSTNIAAMNEAKGYTSSNPQPQPRGDEIPAEATTATPSAEFSVHVSGPTYDSHWHYDPNTGHYNRSQAGQPHTDREKGQITAEVVVVLNQDWYPAGGSRIKFHTTGTGSATIWHKGTQYEANWRKADKNSQYTFTSTTTNEELLLPRGKTWITVKPLNQRNP